MHHHIRLVRVFRSAAPRRPSSRGLRRHGRPGKVGILPAGEGTAGPLGNGVQITVTAGEAAATGAAQEGRRGKEAGLNRVNMFPHI